MLKAKILRNLNKFPYVTKVLKQAIEQRLTLNNFLENFLVFSLYKEDKSRISNLEKLIRDISSDNIFDIGELVRALNGKDKNFDFKMYDFFAILYGIRYFINKGATEIHMADINSAKKISEKEPDILIVLNNRKVYAEVKNINEEDKLLLALSNYLNDRSVVSQKIYKKTIRIHAKSISVDFDIDDNKRLHKIKAEFATKLEKELINGQENFSFKIDEIYFDISAKQSREFNIIYSKESLGTKTGIINASDEFLSNGRMYYKALKKIYDAFLQLLSNRRGDFNQVKNDYIYLHFMGSEELRKSFYSNSFKKKLNLLISNLDINKIVNVVTNLSS